MKNKMFNAMITFALLFIIGISGVKAADVKIGTNDKEFTLTGIEGTVKEKEYVKGCDGEIDFLVLTTDSKIYYGSLENPYPNEYPSTVEMKQVTNADTITDLTYTLGGLGCSMPNTAVKLQDSKIKNIKNENNNYSLVDATSDEVLNVIVNNKKYFLPIYDIEGTDEAPIVKKADIKEFKYNKINDGIRILVLTSKSKLYAGDVNISMDGEKLFNISEVTNSSSKMVERLTYFDRDDYGKKTNTNMSDYLNDLAVVLSDKTVRALEHNDQGYYINMDVECVEKGATPTANDDTSNKKDSIKNPKTGNYISYTVGLVFILISGIALLVLKNKKIVNK